MSDYMRQYRSALQSDVSLDRMKQLENVRAFRKALANKNYRPRKSQIGSVRFDKNIKTCGHVASMSCGCRTYAADAPIQLTAQRAKRLLARKRYMGGRRNISAADTYADVYGASGVMSSDAEQYSILSEMLTQASLGSRSIRAGGGATRSNVIQNQVVDLLFDTRNVSNIIAPFANRVTGSLTGDISIELVVNTVWPPPLARANALDIVEDYRRKLEDALTSEVQSAFDSDNSIVHVSYSNPYSIDFGSKKPLAVTMIADINVRW